MDDKIKKIVSAAVIKALNESGGDLVAEMTADVLNKPSYRDRYWGIFADYGSEGTYLQQVARDEIKRLVAEATREAVGERAAEIKALVVAKLDADVIAGKLVDALHDEVENNCLSVNLKLEAESDDE